MPSTESPWLPLQTRLGAVVNLSNRDSSHAINASIAINKGKA